MKITTPERLRPENSPTARDYYEYNIENKIYLIEEFGFWHEPEKNDPVYEEFITLQRLYILIKQYRDGIGKIKQEIIAKFLLNASNSGFIIPPHLLSLAINVYLNPRNEGGGSKKEDERSLMRREWAILTLYGVLKGGGRELFQGDAANQYAMFEYIGKTIGRSTSYVKSVIKKYTKNKLTQNVLDVTVLYDIVRLTSVWMKYAIKMNANKIQPLCLPKISILKFHFGEDITKDSLKQLGAFLQEHKDDNHDFPEL